MSELALYLHVHRATIYRLLKKRDLPGFKIGKVWRFNAEEIDEWRMALDAAWQVELSKKFPN